MDSKYVGKTGEDIACKFLMKRGFRIITRNYLKKWGEIDIVSSFSKVIHFIEVKAVSCENLATVTYETDAYIPEENIHPAKIKSLNRAIQSYLIENDISDETEWQLDSLAVYIDFRNLKAKVRFHENIN